MEEIKKEKATIEMKKWLARYNKESSEHYNELNRLRTELQKIKKDITKATIGFGKAIEIMQQSAENMESKIRDMEIRPNNQSADFMDKFGKDQYKLDFN